ncbi:MAG: hypothetical protein RLZZ395_755, partial [Pseudomonadota bacterium]
DRYRAEWAAAGHAADTLPLMGTTRHMVIAPTDAEAQDLARESYARWHRSFMYLWDLHGTKPGAYFPATWDELAAAGRALAGTPQTVREQMLHQIEVSGINFVLTRFAFGDISFVHSQRSVSLFASDVMPWILERTSALQAA